MSQHNDSRDENADELTHSTNSKLFNLSLVAAAVCKPAIDTATCQIYISCRFGSSQTEQEELFKSFTKDSKVNILTM